MCAVYFPEGCTEATESRHPLQMCLFIKQHVTLHYPVCQLMAGLTWRLANPVFPAAGNFECQAVGGVPQNQICMARPHTKGWKSSLPQITLHNTGLVSDVHGEEEDSVDFRLCGSSVLHAAAAVQSLFILPFFAVKADRYAKIRGELSISAFPMQSVS